METGDLLYPVRSKALFPWEEKKQKEGGGEDTRFYVISKSILYENLELLRKSLDEEIEGYMRFHHEMRHQHPWSPMEKVVYPTMASDPLKDSKCMYDGAIDVVVGSRIYRLGGRRPNVQEGCDVPTLLGKSLELCRDVLYYDYHSPPGVGWVQGPPMNTERGRGGGAGQDHQVVVLNNKLYVFGGCPSLSITGDDTVWAEVLNPYTGVWTPLASPPDSALKSGHLFASVFDSGKILLGSFSSLKFFTYDTESDEWKSLDPPEFGLRFFSNFGNTSHPAVVGSVIYWVYRELHAYDLDSKRFYTGPILDTAVHKFLDNADVKTLHDDPPHLVHLAACENGELFCLIWKSEPSILHCTRFRVYKEEETIEEGVYLLSAPVQSCTLFTLR